MIALLSLLLVVTVSGDEHVESMVGGSVLLPCPCSGRDSTKRMKWQMEEQFTVFRSDGSDISEKYRDRTSVVPESNCSLVLTNVTKEDRGKYLCIWYIGEEYKVCPVHLTVVGLFNICQKPEPVNSPNEKIFHCNVSGYDKDAKIQWSSDGQQLTNSSKTTITHTYTLDTVNGQYSFYSKLVTHLNISEPKCEVKSEGIKADITEICSRDSDTRKQPDENRNRYSIFIPFVAAAGLCLVLWCRGKI